QQLGALVGPRAQRHPPRPLHRSAARHDPGAHLPLRADLVVAAARPIDVEHDLFHSPNSFQIPSTFRLISSAITTSPGQGRANPSLAHFVVASMPILEPKFGIS